MGRFVTLSDVKVITHESWEPGESVTIRKWSIRQKDLLDTAILRIAGTAGEIPEVVVKSVTIPYLLAGIADWEFRNESGAKVPVTEKWIGQLDEETADFIATEIRAFNEGRTAEDQQEFLRSDGVGVENGWEATAGDESDSGDGDDALEL